MSGVKPQGVDVTQLQGAASAEELRPRLPLAVREEPPGRGPDGMFNRSHYEEVLIVQVHHECARRQKQPPEDIEAAHVWKRRYREINDLGAGPH